MDLLVFKDFYKHHYRFTLDRKNSAYSISWWANIENTLSKQTCEVLISFLSK